MQALLPASSAPRRPHSPQVRANHCVLDALPFLNCFESKGARHTRCFPPPFSLVCSPTCTSSQRCCNKNCVDGPGEYLAGAQTNQQCNGQCCATCKPIEGLPDWHGGTADQLACAVVSMSKKLGLNLWTQWAYIMGTIQRETGGIYKPVRECYAYASKAACTTYFNSKAYPPYYGRGYVQLTWLTNYQRFEVRGLFPTLLPAGNCTQHQQESYI